MAAAIPRDAARSRLACCRSLWRSDCVMRLLSCGLGRCTMDVGGVVAGWFDICPAGAVATSAPFPFP